MVLPDLDVGRHETVNRGVRAAEHDVLARPLQMVVDDLEGTGPVPAHDGLGVGADLLEVGQVGIDDRQGHAVQRDAPPAAPSGIAVDVAALHDDVVRQHLLARHASGAELHQVVNEGAGHRPHLDADEPEVMGPRRGHDRATRPGAHHDLRHDGGGGRRHARSRRGQPIVGRAGAHDDPTGSALLGQCERALKRGSGLQGDHVSRLGGIENGLEVAAGGDRDRAAGGTNVIRVHRRARTLRRRGLDGDDAEPKRGSEKNHERALREVRDGSHAMEGYHHQGVRR